MIPMPFMSRRLASLVAPVLFSALMLSSALAAQESAGAMQAPSFSIATGASFPTPTTTMPPNCSELLIHGNFEAGGFAPWLANGVANPSVRGHDSPPVVVFCGIDNVASKLAQAVSVPAQSKPVRLIFWWPADGSAPQPGDALKMLLQYDGNADLLLTLPATGSPGQLREESLDLTAYTGRSFWLTFHAHTDGAQPSLFLVDDVSLTACPSYGREYRLHIPLALRNSRGLGPTPTASLSPAPPTYTPTPTLKPATATPSLTPTATPSAAATATPTSTPDESLVLVVNTTADTDDGACNASHCSLREAIYAANAHSGLSIIAFNIPTGDPGRDANGVCTIRPTIALPQLVSGSTIIDGYTQPGASPNTAPFGQPINAVLKIVLDGSLIPVNAYPDGLDIRSSGNVVRGLVVQSFNNGICTVDVDNNRIEGCFVGTDARGMMAKGNRNMGIWIGGIQDGRGSWNNVVGGSVPQARNLISGNGTGMEIGGGLHTKVQGNYIGTDASGTGALGQTSGSGVRAYYTSSYNLIGGAGAEEANLIAFNVGYGVVIEGGYGANYNTITRNRIHSNAQKGIALLSGGNNGLAAPAITTASRTQASGTACANCTIEVFSDAANEGAIYEGTTTANGSGEWSLNKPAGFSGPNLTATATDASGNTSEFSASFTLPS